MGRNRCGENTTEEEVKRTRRKCEHKVTGCAPFDTLHATPLTADFHHDLTLLVIHDLL